MKLQSKKKVQVKDKIFGGSEVLICIPLISKNVESLLKQAEEICTFKPDIIEWRADYFENIEKSEIVAFALESLHNIIGDTPLLFTLRHAAEGGFKLVTQEKRLEIFEKLLKTKLIDVVDVEMANEACFIEKVKYAVNENKSKLLLSYHNFKETPSKQFIIDKIKLGENLGADISKVAVMPQSYSDVVTLINATHQARENEVDIPIVAVSMGEIGAITRIAGGLFGSDMSFVSACGVSGPGQIPIQDFRALTKILY